MPSAWLDDTLIAERKAGLSAYLTGLLDSPQFRVHKFVIDFLTPSTNATPSGKLSMEDALPSTLTRKAALDAQSLVSVEATPVAAAYYPDWSSDTNPPASLDFSKFDIILFGTSAHSPRAPFFSSITGVHTMWKRSSNLRFIMRLVSGPRTRPWRPNEPPPNVVCRMTTPLVPSPRVSRYRRARVILVWITASPCPPRFL